MIDNILIVIPARYGSSRFPGKPLFNIAGKSLLQRVCETAIEATNKLQNVKILVATDDHRIMQHAKEINVPAILTPETCATGTDRIIAAISQLKNKPKYVINLQGDTPLTPVEVITNLMNALSMDAVVTPVLQLTWDNLEVLRQAKKINPFSGTTAIVNQSNDALWFSKQIIPAIRNEDSLRATNPNQSPIYQHLGIYGYSLELLQTFANLPIGHYEQLEGLEQLRLLEHGYKITAVPVTLSNLHAWRGVDTIADATYVEDLILSRRT